MWTFLFKTQFLGRISTPKIVAKIGSKTYHGYIIVHNLLWLQKCILFHLLATILVTLANHRHNLSLYEHWCTQMHAVPRHTPALPTNDESLFRHTHTHMYCKNLQGLLLVMSYLLLVHCPFIARCLCMCEDKLLLEQLRDRN